MLSEAKLGNSFSEGQFLIPDYGIPYRVDRNCCGGSIRLFVRENIPSKLLSVENSPIEGFYIELHLRKKKYLLCGSYNLNRSIIYNHLDSLRKNLDLYLSLYQKLTLIGDFNLETDNNTVSNFCDTFDLASPIEGPAYYKSPDKPACIDLILTNKSHSFQNSCVI